FVVTVRFVDDAPDGATLANIAEDLVQDTSVAACEIWQAVDPSAQPVSMEEKLRGGDKKIKACLMVDTLRQADAEKIGVDLSRQFAKSDVGVFRVLCQLGRAEGGDSWSAVKQTASPDGAVPVDCGKNCGASDRAWRDNRHRRVFNWWARSGGVARGTWRFGVFRRWRSGLHEGVAYGAA